MAKSVLYTVAEEDTLLPFLLAHVKGISRNSVKNLLTRRQVLVDGKPVTRHDHPLAPGVTVEVLAPGAKAPTFSILYEDDELLAVDKPAGLLTVATDKEKTKTAYHFATEYLKGRGGRVFVLHRLDKDTSGVLLFAKREAVKRAFQDNWEAIVRTRRYLALVEGVPHPDKGTVRSFLRETATHLVYSVDRPGPGAKEAVTHYRLLDRRGSHSLLEVSIDTGRKNQIRVHMKDLGHPVAGDRKYGATTDPLGRLGLHAHTLALVHPVTGKELVFTAPAPKGFR